MHFMDSIFIFGLALILFGPKKLPEIGRQIGKIVLEFRKASNEFKMQIEDELRAAEQAERQKKIAEETAALTASILPVPAALETSTPSTSALPTSTPSSLTVQPPTSGEQVSANPPYRRDAEPLAAVIVESPGEDPHPDAIAEVYPVSDTTLEVAPPPTSASHTTNSQPAPPPPDRYTFNDPHGSVVQETDQATTHHG
jgi:sec-independent protein translocase protein TatB